MEMLELFWVFFWLLMIGIVLVFVAAWMLDKKVSRLDFDEHETNPGATAPGLPHHRSKK